MRSFLLRGSNDLKSIKRSWFWVFTIERFHIYLLQASNQSLMGTAQMHRKHAYTVGIQILGLKILWFPGPILFPRVPQTTIAKWPDVLDGSWSSRDDIGPRRCWLVWRGWPGGEINNLIFEKNRNLLRSFWRVDLGRPVIDGWEQGSGLPEKRKKLHAFSLNFELKLWLPLLLVFCWTTLLWPLKFCPNGQI